MSVIGENIKELRTQRCWTQAQLAEKLNVERSLIAKVENGKASGSNLIDGICKIFGVEKEQLNRMVSIGIPDTSALLKNRKLLDLMVNSFDTVIVPYVVKHELNHLKDKGKKESVKQNAWLCLMEITRLINEGKVCLLSNQQKNYLGCQITNNDEQIKNIALSLRRGNKKVVIIHDDVDFSSFDDNMLLRDFISSFNKKVVDIASFKEIDTLSENNLGGFKKKITKDILNTYLEDGQTLLIHAVRKKQEKKVQWLISNGANINQCDDAKYGFPPITHSIQVNSLSMFKLLIELGADINQGSMNIHNTGYLYSQNENNTPLMVIAWHGREDFFMEIMKHNPCLNQQDANGYTALHKAAIQDNRHIYNVLKNKGMDVRIRDRFQHTASYYRKEHKKSESNLHFDK